MPGKEQGVAADDLGRRAALPRAAKPVHEVLRTPLPCGSGPKQLGLAFGAGSGNTRGSGRERENALFPPRRGHSGGAPAGLGGPERSVAACHASAGGARA